MYLLGLDLHAESVQESNRTGVHPQELRFLSAQRLEPQQMKERVREVLTTFFAPVKEMGEENLGHGGQLKHGLQRRPARIPKVFSCLETLEVNWGPSFKI